MFDFLKKNKEDKTQAQVDADNKDANTAEGGDKVLHAIDTGEAVPQALKDKLAEIRESQDPNYVEVELNDDGTPVNPEHAELLKTGSVVKDDDTTSGDANNQGDKSQEDTEAEADEVSDVSIEISTLDPRLVEAGKSMGWADEKIKLVAETDLTILEDIASRQEISQTHRKDDKDGVKDDDTPAESPALTKLREKLGDEADEILGAITESVEKKFKSRFDEVDAIKERTQQENERRASFQRAATADEIFDKVSEHFPEIGLTKELPKNENTGELVLDSPQMKARGQIYKTAMIFHQANGGTFESAMKNAVQHYAGGQGTQAAARQVVKDLNKQKQRFTPKPTRRKTVKVFKSDKHKAAHIVQEAKRKAGLI